MKGVTLFYLETCPYCVKAKRALEELLIEYPSFNEIEIDWIEESRQPALAAQFDYYYVPTVYLGEEKLYEAQPGQSYTEIKEKLRSSLETAMNRG